ncbi:MAG: YceI family protein [Cycloclasticus sp.]
MRLNKTFVTAILIFFSLTVQAQYQLDEGESSLYFVSIKKNKIGEVHSFSQLAGSINDKGFASIRVNLASVKTHIEIRDERMKAMLFETDRFPEAIVTTQIVGVQNGLVAMGERVVKTVELSLNLHGQLKTFQAIVQIVGLSNGALGVSSVKPIMLNAADFELGAGIEKLMDVAKLPSISTAVPVYFNLVFKPE